MANRTDNSTRCSISKKPNDGLMLILATFTGIAIGFLLGISFPTLSLTKINFPSSILPSVNTVYVVEEKPERSSKKSLPPQELNSSGAAFHKIWVPSNPRGAEMLPPRIVAAESDFYLRRLWGLPKDDLPAVKPKYLVAFTVAYGQRKNIDACVKKFSDNFTIVLFHYDGRTSEYDEFEWSKRAIHVSVPKQTKWWYAKRFLHPDIIAPYEYIFIWDEDLGVENFDAEEYIKLVKKHGLEISQPAVESRKSITWKITKRIPGIEVHKEVEEKPGRCNDPHKPPCAGFIEIMAPVFSRDSWRCVWHMIQNDLVHGWGLDFALRKCVEPAYEKIGVVDSQWIIHQKIPSLTDQGTAQEGKSAFQGVRERCKREWTMFQKRMTRSEQMYLKEIASASSNSTLA
uniref:Lysine ketoglutarate reductase trans-splicing protein n=1 Tax=Noccaea caerulescens TaxID=107243 RepID=A0A1J3EFY8_NOCCA